jgi:hypothetical protein
LLNLRATCNPHSVRRDPVSPSCGAGIGGWRDGRDEKPGRRCSLLAHKRQVRPTIVAVRNVLFHQPQFYDLLSYVASTLTLSFERFPNMLLTCISRIENWESFRRHSGLLQAALLSVSLFFFYAL